jgi:hypothetical protein
MVGHCDAVFIVLHKVIVMATDPSVITDIRPAAIVDVRNIPIESLAPATMLLLCTVDNLPSFHLARKILTIGAAFLALGYAHAGTLSVRAERPDRFKILNQNRSWNIVLEGEIDEGAPARVDEALKKTGHDGADVYITSPGGNLFAGMKIGRIIRQYGANTHLGKLVPDPEHKILGRDGVRTVAGKCYSACTLAFLGGVYRYTSSGSEYGVHRFSSAAGATSSDLDIAQVVSAAIGNYIRDMGVEPALFDLMVQDGKDKVLILTGSELKKLSVVNNGRRKPEWSIEANELGQYLRGVQDSVFGQGKVVFACLENNQILFQSFYDAGTERALSIAKGGWYHSLQLDMKDIPLANPAEIRANGNEIYSIFILTTEQALAVSSSASIGHAMQLGRDAPTYVGFQVDVPQESSKKITAFIRNCLRKR